MKKLLVIMSSFIVISVFFIICVKGASYWTGHNVYDEDTINNGITENNYWNITPDKIAKVETTDRVYEFSDITSYSAYVSNNESYVSNYITKSFYWFNYSRLMYVKLIKVEPGKRISFVFSNSYYVYCAEFSSDFYMLDDGKWITTGDTITLTNSTKWIMVVFRQDNGNSANGSGTGTSITSEEIQNQECKYIVFSPFSYTFDTQGAIYMGSTDDFTLDRLGVKYIIFPKLSKEGYIFLGWKSSSGNIYNGVIESEYDSDLFMDQSFTAQWQQIYVSSVNITDNQVDIDLSVTDSYSLTADVLPEDALNRELHWSISDTSIASVDQNGKVTSLQTGSCYVYATATDGSGVYDSCLINIIKSDIKGEFEESSIVMEPGEVYTPTINITAAEGSEYEMIYSTVDSNVATVDDEGNITAVSEGIAEISITSNSGYKDIITVYVLAYNVIIPAYIEPDTDFDIEVVIKNNGVNDSLNRRTVQVTLNNISQLQRLGDSSTAYSMNLFSSGRMEDIIGQKETLVETKQSTSEEFVVTTASPIEKPGDYSGYIEFGIKCFYIKVQ